MSSARFQSVHFQRLSSLLGFATDHLASNPNPAISITRIGNKVCSFCEGPCFSLNHCRPKSSTRICFSDESTIGTGHLFVDGDKTKPFKGFNLNILDRDSCTRKYIHWMIGGVTEEEAHDVIVQACRHSVGHRISPTGLAGAIVNRQMKDRLDVPTGTLI